MRKTVQRLWVLVVALGLAAVAQAVPLFARGQHIVFYGDSITEQRLYTRYVQQYLLTRYPDWQLTFHNAGWGGDTAGGALGRLERDVLPLKPDLVTLFFGMNDGGYRTVDEATVSNYRNNMDKLVAAIKAAGVRVVVFSPGCVDEDKKANLAEVNYNKMLEALAGAAREVAEKHGAPFVDVFHPLLETQRALKAQDAAFSFIPDAVHPNAAGHLVMAKTMLEGLGAEPMATLGSVDLATGTGQGMSVAAKSDREVVLVPAAPVAVPFWYEPGSSAVAQAGGVDDLVGQRLTVTNLPAGSWDLNIDGERAARASSAAWAAGVAVPATAWSATAKQVHDLLATKEENYYQAWRRIRLPYDAFTATAAVLDGLMAADRGYQALVDELLTHRTQPAVALLRAASAENLALGRPYTVSDENRYNWGIGGLTNGRWEASPQAAFATGDGADLNKHATIELAAPAAVGTVVVGVPDFGSTRTIEVAVSADGQTFETVGSHEFAQGRTQRWTYTFTPRETRYVRLIWPDRWPDERGYPITFGFATEVSVHVDAE